MPPVFFDLSARAKWRVTGADRLRFLNGQTTNDLRRASDTAAIEACVINAKGKIDAHIFVSSWADGILIDTENAALFERLDRYIIADDVAVEDVTGQFALFHALGPKPAETFDGGHMIAARRFLAEGFDLWIDQGETERAHEFLKRHFSEGDAAAAETLRIESGLPREGFELTAEIIPVEANLESRAIDYAKGCYIGQEVISRMKMSGQTNKRLCGLRAVDGTLLKRGARLTTEEGRDVGWVTSVTRSERLGKNIALGFVKRGSNDPGMRLHADSTIIEIVALPFA